MIRIWFALTLGCLVLACGGDERQDSGPEIVQPTPRDRPEREIEGQQVEIFFADANAALQTEMRELSAPDLSKEQEIRELAEAVTGSPETATLAPTFPPGTVVRAVYVLGQDVAVVDLGGEGLRAWSAGSTEEMLAAYSLVNTISANAEGIVSVQILVEGHEVETLAGHLDLTRPLRPRNL